MKEISSESSANTWKTRFQKMLTKGIQNLHPQSILDWASITVQKRGTQFYGTLTTLTLSTFFLADLTALILGNSIPDPLISRFNRLGNSYNRTKSVTDYRTIFSRNLFNSQGLIPGEEGENGSSSDLGGTPVKSTLPFNLIGTLILDNELRSIATIEDKSLSIVYPLGIDDEIPNKIKVTKIEARKVIFINQSSGRREYLELPEELQISHPVNMGKLGGSGGIEKITPTQFNVSRTEVDRTLSDFNNILTQARAIPNSENGVPNGYKLLQIVPGSIYDKLGLQNGDVISGLNGQPINDPGKAFEMLSELKTSNHLELQIKKDGKQLNYTYDIH